MKDNNTRKEREIILLNAAKKIFAENGYHEASIDEIIREADVARGTFYLYFSSKRNIFNAILDLTLSQVNQHIEVIRLGADELSPVDQLKANLRRVFDQLLQDPYIAKILFVSALGIDSEAMETLNVFYRAIANQIERALQQGMMIGLLAKCNAEVASYSILGSIKEVLTRIVLVEEGQPSTAKIDEVIDEVIRINLYGFYVRGII